MVQWAANKNLKHEISETGKSVKYKTQKLKLHTSWSLHKVGHTMPVSHKWSITSPLRTYTWVYTVARLL